MKKNLCIVAPHPDDEILGCGGLIYNLKSLFSISVIYVTNISNDNSFDSKKKLSRELEIKKIKKNCNFVNSIKFDFMPSSLSYANINRLIENFRNIFDQIRPNIILIPNVNDAHSDHFFSNRAAVSSLKVFRAPYVDKIYSYEVLSETNFGAIPFKPDTYFNIGKNGIEFKLKNMKIYKSELKKHPFPRSLDSIKSLSIIRGSEAGYEYAEGFMTIFKKNDKSNF